MPALKYLSSSLKDFTLSMVFITNTRYTAKKKYKFVIINRIPNPTIEINKLTIIIFLWLYFSKIGIAKSDDPTETITKILEIRPTSDSDKPKLNR